MNLRFAPDHSTQRASGRAESPAGSARRKEDPEKVKHAAHDFEALLVGQLLKSLQTSEEGAFGSEDGAGSPIFEMAQEQVAKAICSGGGLGLANMVVAGLTETSPFRAKTATQGTAMRSD